MVQRRQAVHRVRAIERGRGRGPESRHRPPVVGDLFGHQLAAGCAECNEGQVAGQSRVRPIPRGQIDRVRVDLLHVDDVRVLRQVQGARFATTQHQDLLRLLACDFKVGGVGQDLIHPAQPDRRGQVGVRSYHHGDRTKPGQRGNGDQRAGPRLHQHTHPVALPHPDLDQAANHIVDAAVHRLVGVHAPVEQQELALRGVVCLFFDDAAQRDPGVVVELSQPGQPRQRPDRFHGQCAHRFVSADDGVGRTPSQRNRGFGSFPDTVHEPRAQRDTAFGVLGRLIGHHVDAIRLVAPGIEPLHPFGDRRPALLRRLGSHDETEMPCPDAVFVDLGVGRSPPDPAHRRRLADVVDLADESQYRTGDIGERDHLPVDGEAAGHHPVVGDELLEQLRDRRARPGDPTFGFEKAALLFTR